MRQQMDHALLLPKLIDNSKVVREVDPRASRERWALVLLVACLVAGLGLYAWPHLERRRAGLQAQQLDRERERLVEENRKLRLERASLEELQRVEAIARRELGLTPPGPEQVVVVERQAAPPAGQLARAGAGGEAPGESQPWNAR
jgi:cell division protein FtsL